MHPTAVPDDRCPACQRKLAYLSGPVLVASRTPGKDYEEEYGADGRLTPRARRRSFVGCGSCGRAAPADHPMQVKLDADWEKVERAEGAEQARAAKATQMQTTPYRELNPVADLADRVENLQRRVTLLEQQLKPQAGHKKKSA